MNAECGVFDACRWLVRRCRVVAAASGLALVLGAGGGCNSEPQAGQQQLDRSLEALRKCESERDRLQEDLNALKVKLAQALANPGTIKVDPALLTIEGKSLMAPAREGTLTQEQVFAVIGRSKGSLEACYTRALKRNSALHHGSITLNVSFSVRSTGRPTRIDIQPNRDGPMIACMVKAIERWPFPEFEGQPVDVEAPVTLLPKR
ncbi:MAG: AgmX/PglI C-terminal domain-containing protein [Proteobacteria bacterium]|nr:AgmX/PglI C-terminal domain-containing protein [Pseudomonadota bacterium]